MQLTCSICWSFCCCQCLFRALREAAELLAEAQELARQQTLSDLMSSWTADSATQQPPPVAAADAFNSSSSSSSSPAIQQQPDPAAAAAAGAAQLSSAAALEAFWCEQGLSQPEAQRLMREVQADPQLATSCCNTQVCETGDNVAGSGLGVPQG